MSVLAGTFTAKGHTYRMVPDVIGKLPKGVRFAATTVWMAIKRFEARGELDERATDKRFAEETGFSESFVQKGFHALDTEAKDTEAAGTPLIRRDRAHGRRTITPAPLAAGRRGRDDQADEPPDPRLPENTGDTTIDAASSSSSTSAPKTDQDPIRIASPDLIARACALIEKATPGRVIDAVRIYTADWVERALDRVMERNAEPGKKPVRSWGFVLTTLGNWRKEGGPPPRKAATPPPTTTTRPTPTAEPTRPFTAEELDELLGRCQQGPPAVQRFGAGPWRRRSPTGPSRPMTSNGSRPSCRSQPTRGPRRIELDPGETRSATVATP